MLLFFAKKYLFSNKNTKAINIISWVSILAIAIGTAALIIVLSVFNGLDFFVKNLYTCFYNDVKITSTIGKTFTIDNAFINEINKRKVVKYSTVVLEENVLLTNNNEQQSIVTIKGIDSNYNNLTQIFTHITEGDSNLFNTQNNKLIIGSGVANTLGVSSQNILPLNVYAFKKDANLSLAPQDAYNQLPFLITGVFEVQDEFNSKYVLSNLQNVQYLLQQPNEISSIELKLQNENKIDFFVNEFNLKNRNKNLIATSRYQQNKTLYYILKSEKWMVFAIMTLMLIIASFNMVCSLSMLVLEKQKDINILKAIGAHDYTIKNIFLLTGTSIGVIGASIGCIIGLLICLLQQYFKVFKMAGESLLLDAYPIKIIPTDVLIIMLTVIAISICAAYLPSRKAVKS